jgi:hypothetical protein
VRLADAAISGVTVLTIALGAYVILHLWALRIDYAVGTALVAHCEDRERSGEGAGGLLVPRLARVFAAKGATGSYVPHGGGGSGGGGGPGDLEAGGSTAGSNGNGNGNNNLGDDDSGLSSESATSDEEDPEVRAQIERDLLDGKI